jgi:hypothetical protein
MVVSWELLRIVAETRIIPYPLSIFPGHPIPALHDFGIFVTTLGLIFVYLLFIYFLRKASRPFYNPGEWKWETEVYYSKWFVFVLIAWFGIWIIMHHAFVLKVEQFLGHIYDPVELIQLPLTTFNLIGTVFVFILCLFALGWSVRYIRRIEEPIADDAEPDIGRREKLEALGKEFLSILRSNWIRVVAILIVFVVIAFSLWLIGQNWRSLVGYILLIAGIIGIFVVARLSRTILISDDWKFFGLVFVPYFLAAFAVWIFMFEGFIAKLFEGVRIIWAWLPQFIWTADRYFALGIVLLIGCIIGLGWMIFFVSRDPKAHFMVATSKVQLTRFSIFSVISLILLSVGLVIMVTSFYWLELLVIPQAYLYHTLGWILIFAGLAIMFFTIVLERKWEIGIWRLKFTLELEEIYEDQPDDSGKTSQSRMRH